MTFPGFLIAMLVSIGVFVFGFFRLFDYRLKDIVVTFLLTIPLMVIISLLTMIGFSTNWGAWIVIDFWIIRIFFH